MIKKLASVDNLKMVGNAGLRIGKDVVREGTKVVIGKTAGAVIGATLTGGVKKIKTINLDDVLGDITRMEKKKEKKLKKELRKQEKLSRKEKEFNESVRQGLVKEADELIKELGKESEEK